MTILPNEDLEKGFRRALSEDCNRFLESENERS